jgi:hypothetical protein
MQDEHGTATEDLIVQEKNASNLAGAPQVVARVRIELTTPAFSVQCSTN